MSFKDRMNTVTSRAATEAGKALDKGKGKTAELQLKRRMDGVAEKLGYLVLEEYRSKSSDDQARQELLDELIGLEEQIAEVRAQTAAKVAARTEKTTDD